MQGTWRCQMLRRIQNQPAEMKIVLTALSDALIAGKSEIVTPQIHTDEPQMKEGRSLHCKNLCKSVFICGSVPLH
jgi:hypothetical protein